MSGAQIATVSSMALFVLVTYYLGFRSPTRHGSQDFGIARRTVRSRRNAAAVSGEYLCIASFLGITGAVLTDGADAIWYPIGFTSGFLALMIFVAAPLRRSGAYTLPDFVEGRLASLGMRVLASVVVVLIAVLYIVPQLQGAELAFTTLLPVPDWAGPVTVTVVVLINVLGGGMRSITVTQAFQYWLKLFAIAAPTLVLFVVFLGTGTDRGAAGLGSPVPPVFTEQTTLTVQTPVTLQVGETEQDVAAGTTLEFDEGSPVPVVIGSPADNASWLAPGDGDIMQLLGTYSLIIALLLGTMGLPHILVRFYTNPDGKAARRTTLHVLVLAGLFYLFPTLLGALSRLYVPELLLTGQADAAVLLLPSKMLPGVPGQILATVIVAGVFSAFLAAASGLVFSVAGVVSTDLLPERLRDVRVGAVLIALVPLGLALVMPARDLAHSIGFAFALAASTFCPLLVLGIWWRGLTAKGAGAGVIVGGGIVLVALGLDILSGYTGGWAPSLVQQPALISVPAAFAAALLISGATKSDIPSTVNAVMLRMHAPDPLGFVRDKEIPRFGLAEERVRLSSGRHRR